MVAIQPSQNGGREIWLDGLRGFAAAIVAWFHLTNYGLKMPYRSFWDEPAEQNRHLIQLPPFRIIFAGQAMVDIFFVVSGYSISIALVKLRNRDATSDFYRRLTSALFRRMFRLFFPVLVMSTISHILYYFNFYAWVFTKEQGFPGCIPLTNPWPHIMWYLRTNFNILNLQSNQNATLNDHLWTIPVEMRGSMFVWLAMLGLASVRANVRFGIVALLGFRFLWIGSPEFAAFFAGLTFAELDDSTSSLELPLLADMEKTQVKRTWDKLREPAKWVLFCTSVYLICLPVKDPFPPDWFFVDYLVSPFWAEWEIKMRSWQTIGAALFIATLRKTPTLRKPFETQFAQFLGAISFSLYLVHQTVYRILLNRVLDAVAWVCMGQGFWAAEKEENHAWGVFFLGWFVATVGIGGLLGVLSKFMARAVDQRAVSLAHWVEKRLSR